MKAQDIADGLRDLTKRLDEIEEHAGTQDDQDDIEAETRSLREELTQVQQDVDLIQQAMIEQRSTLTDLSLKLEATEARTAPAVQLARAMQSQMIDFDRGDTVIGMSTRLLRWAHDVIEHHFHNCEDDIPSRDLGMLATLKQRLGIK